MKIYQTTLVLKMFFFITVFNNDYLIYIYMNICLYKSIAHIFTPTLPYRLYIFLHYLIKFKVAKLRKLANKQATSWKLFK